MEAFFQFLQANPYILLFFTVGLAVWVGKFSVKGYGLGMVAAAVVVGVALATWASIYGVKLQLDNFAKSLFYYLFMYGVGLRVGPSFINSLKRRRAELHLPGRALQLSSACSWSLFCAASCSACRPARRGEFSRVRRPCRPPSARPSWP